MPTEPHIASLDPNELAVFLALRRNDGEMEISMLIWEASVIACDELHVDWTYDDLDKISAVVMQSPFVDVQAQPEEGLICRLVESRDDVQS